MTTSRAELGAHPHADDQTRRAKPLGAYVATLGALILFVSMWLNWVGLGPNDSETNFSSGYEADSLIPFMGLLGIGFSAALLYALKRADRGQHRGLSLASFAVGLASFLWILFFLIDPIETVKYAGANGEGDPNVTTSWGLWIGLLGSLLWTLGSFLLAKEPEGDVEHDVVHRTRAVAHETPVATQHVTTQHVGTQQVAAERVGTDRVRTEHANLGTAPTVTGREYTTGSETDGLNATNGTAGSTRASGSTDPRGTAR
jgi:hypothetical protein